MLIQWWCGMFISFIPINTVYVLTHPHNEDMAVVVGQKTNDSRPWVCGSETWSAEDFRCLQKLRFLFRMQEQIFGRSKWTHLFTKHSLFVLSHEASQYLAGFAQGVFPKSVDFQSLFPIKLKTIIESKHILNNFNKEKNQTVKPKQKLYPLVI